MQEEEAVATISKLIWVIGHEFDGIEVVGEQITDTQMHGQSDDELCYVHVESSKACEERICCSGCAIFFWASLIVFENLTE